MNALVEPASLAAPRAGRCFSEQFTITAEDMEGFAAITGDRRPIHAAADFARQSGFSGRVVYEGLVVARLSRSIARCGATETDGLWGELRVEFHHPLHVGEAALLRLSVDEVLPESSVACLSFRLDTVQRPVASGSVDILMRAVA
ncbi:MAG: hypothetical protein FJX02_07570 [Alphaproteobacteria bacterium]|nr:hypothetical protein [Alphaproteobacteria bacterium]